MEVQKISVPRFHSPRLPIPEHLFMAIGRKQHFRVLCYQTLGALDRSTHSSRYLHRRKLSCFSTPSRLFSGCCAVVDFFFVVAGVLTLTSGYFFFGTTARSQIAYSCSFGDSDDFTPGSLKTPLVRMRPRGYAPHGYAGLMVVPV